MVSSQQEDLFCHRPEKSKGSYFRHVWIQVSKKKKNATKNPSVLFWLCFALTGHVLETETKATSASRLVPTSVTHEAGGKVLPLSGVTVPGLILCLT